MNMKMKINPKTLDRITFRDKNTLITENELGGRSIYNRDPGFEHDFDWEASDEDVLIALQGSLHPDGVRWSA